MDRGRAVASRPPRNFRAMIAARVSASVADYADGKLFSILLVFTRQPSPKEHGGRAASAITTTCCEWRRCSGRARGMSRG